MSSFHCEYCGVAIIDSGPRYTTFCPHYPDKYMSRSQQRSHQQWLKSLKPIDDVEGFHGGAMPVSEELQPDGTLKKGIPLAEIIRDYLLNYDGSARSLTKCREEAKEAIINLFKSVVPEERLAFADPLVYGSRGKNLGWNDCRKETLEAIDRL